MSLKEKIQELREIARNLDLDYEELYQQIKTDSYSDLLDKNKGLEREIEIKNNEIKSLREAMFKLTHAYVDLQRRFKNESIYSVSKDDLSDRGQEKTT